VFDEAMAGGVLKRVGALETALLGADQAGSMLARLADLEAQFQ
jgi:hypothetical protein